jgi:hypothetical protein
MGLLSRGVQKFLHFGLTLTQILNRQEEGLFKKAVQQGRKREEGEAYTGVR